METLNRDEIERLMFFEQAREQAEKDWQHDNTDAQALTRWGGALLELAHFRQGSEAYEMIEQAVAKFREALAVNNKRHDTLWCLGNAYTSQGFLTTDSAKANDYFQQATECFKKAIALDPSSDVYKKALEMTAKAPELHAELQRQLQGSTPAMVPKGKETNTDFWFDVAGWVCLFGIGVSLIALSRSAAPQAAA